jgi:hypothetical protein
MMRAGTWPFSFDATPFVPSGGFRAWALEIERRRGTVALQGWKTAASTRARYAIQRDGTHNIRPLHARPLFYHPQFLFP